MRKYDHQYIIRSVKCHSSKAKVTGAKLGSFWAVHVPTPYRSIHDGTP